MIGEGGRGGGVPGWTVVKQYGVEQLHEAQDFSLAENSGEEGGVLAAGGGEDVADPVRGGGGRGGGREYG